MPLIHDFAAMRRHGRAAGASPAFVRTTARRGGTRLIDGLGS